MRYLFIGAVVAILQLAACGPMATPKTVPTSPSAIPTPAQATFDSPPPVKSEDTVREGLGEPMPSPAASVRLGPSPTIPLSPEPTAIPHPAVGGTEGGETLPSLGEAPVVEYEWSGGLMGMRQRVVIYADGQVVSLGSSRGVASVSDRVDTNALGKWLAEVKTAGFFEMKDSYLTGKNTCCDRITYQLTVRYNGQTKTVTTIDAAPGQPPQLPELLGRLNRLLMPLQAP